MLTTVLYLSAESADKAPKPVAHNTEKEAVKTDTKNTKENNSPKGTDTKSRDLKTDGTADKDGNTDKNISWNQSWSNVNTVGTSGSTGTGSGSTTGGSGFGGSGSSSGFGSSGSGFGGSSSGFGTSGSSQGFGFGSGSNSSSTQFGSGGGFSSGSSGFGSSTSSNQTFSSTTQNSGSGFGAGSSFDSGNTFGSLGSGTSFGQSSGSNTGSGSGMGSWWSSSGNQPTSGSSSSGGTPSGGMTGWSSQTSQPSNQNQSGTCSGDSCNVDLPGLQNDLKNKINQVNGSLDDKKRETVYSIAVTGAIAKIANECTAVLTPLITNIQKDLPYYREIINIYNSQASSMQSILTQDKFNQLGSGLDSLKNKWATCKDSLANLLQSISGNSNFINDLVSNILKAPTDAANQIKLQVDKIKDQLQMDDKGALDDSAKVVQCAISSSILNVIGTLSIGSDGSGNTSGGMGGSGTGNIFDAAMKNSQKIGDAYKDYLNTIVQKVANILGSIGDKIGNLSDASGTVTIINELRTNFAQASTQIQQIQSVYNAKGTLLNMLGQYTDELTRQRDALNEKLKSPMGYYKTPRGDFNQPVYDAEFKCFEGLVMSANDVYKRILSANASTIQSLSNEVMTLTRKVCVSSTR